MPLTSWFDRNDVGHRKGKAEIGRGKMGRVPQGFRQLSGPENSPVDCFPAQTPISSSVALELTR